MQAQLSRQHAYVEPLQGFEDPISWVEAENPVYLKSCKHFFEKPRIEEIFRNSFQRGNEADCPTCRHPYLITPYVEKYGDREVAIGKFFEKILVPTLVPGETNEKLAKIDNLIAAAEKNERTIAEKDKQINDLMQNIMIVAKERDEFREESNKFREESNKFRKENTTLREENDQILEERNVSRVETAHYKSVANMAIGGGIVIGGGVSAVAIAISYVVIAKAKS